MKQKSAYLTKCNMQSIAIFLCVCNGKPSAHLSPEAIFICDIVIKVDEILFQGFNCLHNFMDYYMFSFVLLGEKNALMQIKIIYLDMVIALNLLSRMNG